MKQMAQVPDLNVWIKDDFLPNQAVLFDELRAAVDWDCSMLARKTASFGVPYNYSQMSYPAVKMPSMLVPVVAQLEAELDVLFNNCLLNFYETGHNKMGFHADDTTDLQPGTGVAIVSLGGMRKITYRRKKDPLNQRSFELLPGSLLYMDADVQLHWVHAIKRQTKATARISLTWRAFNVVE